MLSVSQVSSGSYCSSKKYRKIPKIIKPQGLYFSKALFEGLIFGGAYIRRGLSTEGNIWRGLYMEGLIFGILRYPVSLNILKKQKDIIVKY